MKVQKGWLISPHRWDTSHFKKTGGPQRNNYVIHPEFVSEAYPEYHCW